MRPRVVCVCAVLLSCGCAVEAEAGWETDLAQRIDEPGTFANDGGGLAASADGATLAVGDSVTFGVTLVDGDDTKSWEVDVRVAAIDDRRVLDGRSAQAFEERCCRARPGSSESKRRGSRCTRRWMPVRARSTTSSPSSR